jgi:hypothetical protein
MKLPVACLELSKMDKPANPGFWNPNRRQI